MNQSAKCCLISGKTRRSAKKTPSRKENSSSNASADRCATVFSEQRHAEIIANQFKINPELPHCTRGFNHPGAHDLRVVGSFLFTQLRRKSNPTRYEDAPCTRTSATVGSEARNCWNNTHKFFVLHSYDYASAREGAKHIPAVNPDGIAISFGGAIASRRWIRNWNLGDKNRGAS